MNFTPLPRSFFLDAPAQVARALLGKLVVSRHEGELLAGRIVETEAYFGADDPAAHAFNGRTARNAVLFGPPGHAYVYFVYGMYYCLNVSCEPEGCAGCVLIRALEPVAGLDRMAALRGQVRAAPGALASGPGKLCQALGITRLDHNGVDVTSAASTLIFADDRFPSPRAVVGPRIGIRKAIDLAARFCVDCSPFVSRR